MPTAFYVCTLILGFLEVVSSEGFVGAGPHWSWQIVCALSTIAFSIIGLAKENE